ncbi:MAG: hypothetical protein ACM308_04715 [Qipengyuania vulgaris]
MSQIAFLGLVVAGYFGVGLYARTPVTAPIDSRAGIEQRAAALDKVLRYDDLVNGRMRRGGLLKDVLLRPLEPDDEEMEGAADLVGLIFAAQQTVPGCGLVTGNGESMNEAQKKMLREVVDYLEQPDAQWRDPALRTLGPALQSVSAC